MKLEPEWIKNSGEFMMTQTVNTPILIWSAAPIFSVKNHPEQKWASAFINLLLEMKKVKEKAIEKGKDSLSDYYYHKFDKKYDELIEQARKENPLPKTTKKKRGRKKKGKILALVYVLRYST